MKISLVTLLWPLLASASDSGTNVVHPPRISYSHLVSGEECAKRTFVEALSTLGMISITHIPGMGECKDSTMADLHECALQSHATDVHTFPDGTQRLTLATHSIRGSMGTMDHQTHSEPCDSFNQGAASFRPIVSTVTEAFANRMAEYFDMKKKHHDMPLLSVSDDFGFATLADVVQNGEHLEHFRSYQKVEPQLSSSSSEVNETIELHVDQGLFLVFTPGRMYSTRNDSPKISSGFFIKDQHNVVVEVSFDEEDDLVFMIGDGFDQYVNHRLTKTIRPVPHSLIVSTQEGEKEPRAWYGRMVLPPFDAVHPSHGLTFGELREQMIRSTNNKTEESLYLGCSGEMMARDLGSVKCEGDSIYCWHRCMAPTEYDITAEECLSQDLQLLCVDANFQISDGNSHGDYFLGCADPTGGQQQQQQQATSLDNSDFCRGNLGTVMYMDAFHWSFKGGFPCINLFFASWTLDTKVKFLLGMLGVICFAMSVEGVSRLRRVVAHRAQKSAPEERGRYSLYQTSLHGLHALSGYLLMLVTMTYSWELILSVIVGLMIGFFLFSDATRTTSSPCCAFLEPTLESPTSAGGGGANPTTYGAVETSEPRTTHGVVATARMGCCKGECVSECPNMDSSVVPANVA